MRVLFILAVLLLTGCVSDPPATTSASDAGVDAGTQADVGETSDMGATDADQCVCEDGGGGPNTVGACNEQGECVWECTPESVDCGNGVCRVASLDVESCGICDPVDCRTVVGSNSTPSCDGEDAPSCAITSCSEGWGDINDEISDGCECPVGDFEFGPGAIPVDCEDIIATAVFVLRGSNGDGLTPLTPVGSVADAVTIARQEERTVILVAMTDEESPFEENVTISGTMADLTILGGRVPDDDWAGGGATVIRSADADEPTMQISDFDSGASLTLANITLAQSESAAAEGQASITLKLDSLDDGSHTFEDVLVIGGTGGPGIDGDNGTPGINGFDGGPGGNATNGATMSTGGSGGQSSCSPSSAGGDGGGAQTTSLALCPGSGQPGVDGQPGDMSVASGGSGGDNGCAVAPGDGGSGTTMTNSGILPGTNGEASNRNVGRIDANGTWQPRRSGSGDDGATGAGGGGGGGGGSGATSGSLGGGGGGGGAGGCGGGGGRGGSSGGDSIAILVFDSEVDLSGVTIRLGVGGPGGDGGDGACGGAGGEGGEGGTSATVTDGNGGDGGDGTDGVGGGGGAGGHGGASIGTYRVRTTLVGEAAIGATPGETAAGGTGGAAGTIPSSGAQPGGQTAICKPVSTTNFAENGNQGSVALIAEGGPG